MSDDDFIKFHQGIQISSIVTFCIKHSNDIKPIERILTTESYDKLTKKEKEEQVFFTIHQESLDHHDAEKFFRYLIFDYQISEENSIAKIPDLNDKVKGMFENRRLNTKLNGELKTQTTITKKTKV